MFKSRGTKSTASASRVVLVRCLYRRLFRDYYAGINVHLSGEMTQIDQAMSRDELIAVFGREVLLPESTEPLLNLARANVTVELGRRGGVKRVLIPNTPARSSPAPSIYNQIISGSSTQLAPPPPLARFPVSDSNNAGAGSRRSIEDIYGTVAGTVTARRPVATGESQSTTARTDAGNPDTPQQNFSYPGRTRPDVPRKRSQPSSQSSQTSLNRRFQLSKSQGQNSRNQPPATATTASRSVVTLTTQGGYPQQPYVNPATQRYYSTNPPEGFFQR